MRPTKTVFLSTLLLLFLAGPCAAQTHIFPAQDTNNTFTGSNTFTGPVSITNLSVTNFFPTAPGAGTVGSAALPFASVFVGNAATNNIQITGTATAARVFTLPDANSNPVVSSTAPANQFATGVSSSGVVSYAQPGFSNLSGSIALGQTALTTRGDLLVVGVGPALTRLPIAAAGLYPKSNGTDLVYSTLAAAGVGSCTNQFVSALNPDSAPTCTTPSLTSLQFANQGTGTTVLHGNAAGNLSFGSVSLAVDVTGILGAANGGTGTSSAGTTTTVLHGGGLGYAGVSLTADVTGILPVGNGGTGQTTAAAAYNALSPMTTLGDITFESGANTASRLAGNTTTTRKYLSQAGTGAVSAAPSWLQIASADLSDVSSLATLTGTQTLTNKRVSPRVQIAADATSITPTSDSADITVQTNTQVAGTLTINDPTGSPTDGQKLIIRVKTTNAQTYAFGTSYRFSTSVAQPTTTAAGKTDYLGCIWNATDSKWDVVAYDGGH